MAVKVEGERVFEEIGNFFIKCTHSCQVDKTYPSGERVGERIFSHTLGHDKPEVDPGPDHSFAQICVAPNSPAQAGHTGPKYLNHGRVCLVANPLAKERVVSEDSEK